MKMAGPVKKWKAGQVSCALWNNDIKVDGRSVSMLKATIERRYKDKDDQWKSSTSFSRNEIPLVVYCLGKAFGAMLEKDSDQEPKVEEEVIE